MQKLCNSLLLFSLKHTGFLFSLASIKVGGSFFPIIFLITFCIKQVNLSLILYFHFSRCFLRSILFLVLFHILSTLILFFSGPKPSGAQYSEETMAVFSLSLHFPILFFVRKSIPLSVTSGCK